MKRRLPEYLLLLVAALSLYLITRTGQFSILLLCLLLANVVITFFATRKTSPLLLIASRIFLGLVFIFSGYVKVVDPLGFTYKIEDYFIAMNLSKLEVMAFPLAIVLSFAEILIGLALTFKLRIRYSAWALLAFMVVFFPLTLWLALTDAVKDCGCFGDALVLSNWQTFYKNLLFVPFTILILVNRKRYGWYWKANLQWTALGVFALMVGVLNFYCYNHLPIQDFRPWKVGSEIYTPQAPKVYLVYKNKDTGEMDQWLSSELPWQDTVWMSQWEFVEQRVDQDFNPESNYISLTDEYGQEVGTRILHSPEYQLLVVSYDVLKANRKSFEKLNELYDAADNDGVGMAAATATLLDELEPFRHEVQSMYPFYWGDDVTLKTIIRSNPGLLLLKDGKILAKWHHNDFPSFEEVKEKYIEDSN